MWPVLASGGGSGGFSQQRREERKGRMRRQSYSERGRMAQRETGGRKLEEGLVRRRPVYTVVEVEDAKMQEGHAASSMGGAER
jgi:hypothetical protein